MSWKQFIESESKKDYYKIIIDHVQQDAKKHTIYPKHEDIFNAFKYCSLDKVKVVILGQDPYINPGQAHGLSFSVPTDTQLPPSLKNIFKELKSDLGIDTPAHGCLELWARQGVLLLNSTLTVRQGQSNSHKNFGWETFTDAAIKKVNELEQPIVYLLWGSHARSKNKYITNSKHLVLESVHPSPLSAHNGFFGSKPFSQVNKFLIKNNVEPIDWSL